MRNHMLLSALLLASSLSGCESKAPQRHAKRSAAKAPEPGQKKGAAAQGRTTRSAPAPTPIPAPDPSVRPAGWSTGPMSSLRPFAQKLALRAQRALIEGKVPAEAFAPFAVKVQPKLRSELARVKARAIELMGMELELVFYQAEKVHYYLRTFVYPAKGGPEFFKIDGRKPPTGKLSVPHWPLSDFAKSAPDLAKAADGLAGVLRDGRCKLLPIVSPQSLEGKVKPGPMQLSLLSNLRKATLLRQKTCATLPKLDEAKLHMRVDDFALVVLGANEKAIGTLHGEIGLEQGVVKVELARFRIFP